MCVSIVHPYIGVGVYIIFVCMDVCVYVCMCV